MAKLIFDKNKPHRLHRYFMSVGLSRPDGDPWWWNETDRKWELITHNFKDNCQYSNMCTCRTVKAFKSHIKKHSRYLPTGYVFRLTNRYVGYDVTYEIPVFA